MSNYSGDQARIYDLIHIDKEYGQEVQFLLDLFNVYSQSSPSNILDVGCGTGSHSICFAEKNYNVLGIDLSNDMIQFAKKRHNKKKLKFINCDIANVDRKFNFSYSLFNVINHILNFEELISFFIGIKKSLKKNGLYIFDCYNSIATALDNPRDRLVEKNIGGEIIKIETRCEYYNFEEILILNNIVTYKNEIIQYSIKHRLWTPESLKDIIRYAGLQVLDIYKAFDLKAEVKNEDYKIVFVCKHK